MFYSHVKVTHFIITHFPHSYKYFLKHNFVLYLSAVRHCALYGAAENIDHRVFPWDGVLLAVYTRSLRNGGFFRRYFFRLLIAFFRRVVV